MEPTEQRWLPVVGFEDLYEVSDCGEVRSFPRVTRVRGGGTRVLPGRVIKSYRTSGGHVAINLVPHEGKDHMRRTYAHVLVLEAFVSPRPEGFDSCHYDGDPTNNHVSNLRWDSRAANQHDRVRHGRHFLAERDLCDYGHPLDGVMRNRDGSFRQRYCKTCWNARARAKYAAQRAEKTA